MQLPDAVPPIGNNQHSPGCRGYLAPVNEAPLASILVSRGFRRCPVAPRAPGALLPLPPNFRGYIEILSLSLGSAKKYSRRNSGISGRLLPQFRDPFSSRNRVWRLDRSLGFNSYLDTSANSVEDINSCVLLSFVSFSIGHNSEDS